MSSKILFDKFLNSSNVRDTRLYEFLRPYCEGRSKSKKLSDKVLIDTYENMIQKVKNSISITEVFLRQFEYDQCISSQCFITFEDRYKANELRARAKKCSKVFANQKQSAENRLFKLKALCLLLTFMKKEKLQISPKLEQGPFSNNSGKYEIIVPQFHSTSNSRIKLDKDYFNYSVNSAVTALHNNYFNPVAFEVSLFDFFECADSPLVKAHLVPVALEPTFSAVDEWISTSLRVLVKYDGMNSISRKHVINIFLIRYIFNRNPKLFVPNTDTDETYIAKMDAVLARNARELEIPPGIIPESNKDEPISSYLSNLPILKDSINFIWKSQFNNCPIDAAANIAQSLNLIQHICASGGQYLTPKFLAALLSVSDIGNPKNMVESIMYWSLLPGFPSHLISATQIFLEATNYIQ